MDEESRGKGVGSRNMNEESRGKGVGSRDGR